MSDAAVGQSERETQNRVVRLFRDELGYEYLGNWEWREGNDHIEEKLLTQYLKRVGYSAAQVSKAVFELKTIAANLNDRLYTANKEVYKKLRYGITVKVAAGENNETVKLIDWENPLANDFAIAEEVSYQSKTSDKTKRPDIVLYVNGIALAVIELKSGKTDVGEGIRQNVTNQQDRFIHSFFTTVQLLFAGNDTQGLRYGTVGTEAKYYLKWKEDVEDNSRLTLDKYLLKMCRKERLLELIFDFVIFDGGQKKLPRVHQYFGVKAAQDFVNRYEGGIIWHTQGSGKSLTMVYLARWILENNPNARIAIITDRTALDKQIKDVFTDAGETIYRTNSGTDLIAKLGDTKPRLLCSLIHKFGQKGVKNFEQFVKDLQASPIPVSGEVFVFVDECHRTQSDKLHKTMKAMLPNAVFIGFTGTPLLKKDKQTSLEVFGRYIHTYKFNEGVKDEIILDLRYEARDIDQRLTSEKRVDEWFQARTKGLNDFQRSELKKKWGTMQKVLSSRSRMDKIVADITFDFSTKPLLSDGRFNAIMVANSIYEACEYYKLFQKTEFKGRCAVVTSYNPHSSHITTEDTGANTETQKQAIYNLYEELLKDVQKEPGKTKTETYEDKAKDLFKAEPARMKLLIVVSKLLTGFDAPVCAYLYIDKTMQDHGLFQAICRTNRISGPSKDFGYIVDYRNLFDSVGEAIAVYTSELDMESFRQQDIDIMMQDRLQSGKKRLDDAMEALALLCEPVAPPKGKLQYLHYFCGNTEDEDLLKETAPRRSLLYKYTVAFIRAYANIADDMEGAGYSPKEVTAIKKEMDFYLDLREEIKNASGEKLDLKDYEADMRHLIDTYIQADEPESISPFGDMTLLEIIEKAGIDAAVSSLPPGLRKDQGAVAETIENNVRSKIIKDHLLDPIFFEKMSRLLSTLIAERKANAVTYKEYLKKIADLANQMQNRGKKDRPDGITNASMQVLYNNLDADVELARKLDTAIRKETPASWRGNDAKEKMVKGVIYQCLLAHRDKEKEGQVERPPLEYGIETQVDRIFDIIKAQQDY